MGSTYTIPPPIEQQQKSDRGSRASATKSLLSLAGCVALFWLALRNNIHGLHPLPATADRFRQVQIPLLELAGAALCGIGFIFWQLRPEDDAGPGAPRRGLSRNTRLMLWYGSILLVLLCRVSVDAVRFVWPSSYHVLLYAELAAVFLAMFTLLFGGMIGQKTRIGGPQSRPDGRKPLAISNAVLFLLVFLVLIAIDVGTGIAGRHYFPDHRSAVLRVASLVTTLFFLFAFYVLARKPSREPGPSTLQDAEGYDTRAGLRRRMVQAAGLALYVLAFIGLLQFHAVRELRGFFYLGQFGVIYVYVWCLNRLRHRVLFLARNGKYDPALRLDRFVSMLPLSSGSLKGLILFEQARYHEALAYLRPLAFDARGNPRLGSMELYAYALALENDGRPAEAEPLLVAAVKASPEKDSLKVALAGCLLTEEKDPERARELLEQAMGGKAGASDKAHRIARYAWALAACGRRSEAQQQMDAALAAGQGLSPGDLAGVYYFVGEAWRALREDRKAREAFSKALDLRPDGPAATGVQKALAKLNASA